VRQRQRGAVTIELAIVAPLLVLLLIGSIEVGSVLRSGMTASSAARAGVRVGASGAVGRLADHEILQSVRAGLGEVAAADIEAVIVYRADGNGAMAAGCLTASVPGQCNRYTAADLTRPATDFGGSTACSSSAPDRFWCPLARQRQQAVHGGPDWLGVHVRFRHHSLFGTYFADRSVSDRAVMQLEPEFNS
jgi:hypothetical protein